jgi:TolA-binding protein
MEEALDFDLAQSRTGASFRTIPHNISFQLQRHETSLVETQALLQFCDNSLTRINSIERNLQEAHQLRLQSLEAQIKLKDTTITQLKQQVEDLQMLVKLMEQSKRANNRSG